MINVEFKGLSKNDDRLSAVMNLDSYKKSKQLEKEFNGLVCINHPFENQKLIIVVNPDGPEYIKENFCCKDFEKIVNVIIARPRSI